MSNNRQSLNSAINSSHSKRQAIQKNCCNVMETLVLEEVEKQVQQLPVKVANYIKVSEVVAYALNRLPGLYATSKRGWQRQLHYGKTELSKQIGTAVRQGIVAVQRDPLRANEPLNFQEDPSAVEALEKLKLLLQYKDLSWNQLPDVVEQALINTSRGRITWRKPNASRDNTDDKFDWNNSQH